MSFFLGIAICSGFEILKKKFFKIQILGIIEKCTGCFLVYLFLGAFFSLKVQKGWAHVIVLFLVLIPFKVYFLICQKGITRLLRQVAAKTTACVFD